MRKVNGSNLDGLASISKIAYFKNIQILRPLIEINKSAILEFNNLFPGLYFCFLSLFIFC